MDEKNPQPERPVIFYWFLGYATLGISTLFWFYFATRDLKKINQSDLHPFLWIFVPLIGITQFFALPKFIAELEVAESNLHIPSWSKTQNRVWLSCSISSTFATAIASLLEAPFLWQMALTFVWITSILSIATRVKLIKQQAKLVQTRLYGGYSLVEWPFATFGGVFVSAILWFGGLNVIAQGGKTLPNGHQLTNLDLNYAITLHNDSWREVSIGTYSDGSALIEFSGHSHLAKMMVFDHNDEDYITGVTQWRIEQSISDISDGECKESRSLLPNSLFLKIFVECKGTLMGDPEVDMYQYIQIDDEHYIEVYANYGATERVFNKNIDNFRRTIQSLAPLKLQEEIGDKNAE